MQLPSPNSKKPQGSKDTVPERGQKHSWKYLMSLNASKKFRNAYVTADP